MAKQFSRKEICKKLDITEKQLEEWEREFPWIRPCVTRKGEFFGKKEVEILKRIKELYLGYNYTYAGIKRKLKEEFGPPQREDRSLLLLIKEELKAILTELNKSDSI